MTVSTSSTTTPASTPATISVAELALSFEAHAKSREERLAALTELLEARLVSAAWTLRRLPDRERGLLSMRTMIWPDAHASAGDYAPVSLTSLQARLRTRIDPRDIDQMQPTLDLLPLLPDATDRQLLFWAAWHQDGERQAKLPWAKVRRSMGANLSRWTLKRRYENGLKWLASIILAQS